MKILITGAAGFVGENVVPEILRREHQVIALVRSSAPQQWQAMRNLDILRRDLRHLETLNLEGRGIDVVLHLAAATKGCATEQIQDTVVGTRNLLNAARQAGIRRVVGISSIAVLDYRSVRPMTVVDELISTAPCEGLGAYAAAKLQQESLFAEFAKEGDNSCAILRPGLVYNQARIIAAHAGVIRGRMHLLVSHPGEVPVIEVHSLATAIANAAERHWRGREVMHLMDDHLPSQAKYISGLQRRGLLPRGGVVVSWRVFQSLSSLLGGVATASGLATKLPEILSPMGFAARLKPFKFSNGKAKRLLGWAPASDFA